MVKTYIVETNRIGKLSNMDKLLISQNETNYYEGLFKGFLFPALSHEGAFLVEMKLQSKQHTSTKHNTQINNLTQR